MKSSFIVLPSLFLFSLLLGSSSALAAAPLLRLKTGVSDLSMQAGDRFNGQKLKSLITFQPSVLWDFPSFSSRLGFHMLSELNSPAGATPISGIGISAYYHLFGLSTAYEVTDDDTVIQKSRPGPYMVGCLTPVNVNLNKFEESASKNDNYFFSGMVNEVLVGLGYDYPIMQNMLISGEFAIRNGTNVESTNAKISYSGWTIFLTLATSYY